MAKNPRAILCPQCGSPDKSTAGPDLFRCAACQTEYYLDSDDVTVHVRHHFPPVPPPPVARLPARYWVGWGGLLLVLTALAGVYLLAGRPPLASQPMLLTKPIFFQYPYLYADAEQQPVYVALRTEAPRWGSDSVTLYADFFDPRTGRRHREQVLDPLGHRLDHHRYAWHTFPGGRPYLLADQTLYRVDTRTAALVDVTATLLQNFPPASSGIAQLEIDAAHEALRVLTNDGHTYYYLPATGQVLADGLALYRAAYAQLPRRFFTLETPQGAGLAEALPQLLANRPTGQYPALDTQNLTPGRRYFAPRLVYQDARHLLVAAAPTARPDSPASLQCLDGATGQVLWTRPADAYEFDEAVRTRDGFAVRYHTGPAQDYVHGALLLAADGRPVRDFQRARLE